MLALVLLLEPMRSGTTVRRRQPDTVVSSVLLTFVLAADDQPNEVMSCGACLLFTLFQLQPDFGLLRRAQFVRSTVSFIQGWPTAVQV
jgi:hypothetical protein